MSFQTVKASVVLEDAYRFIDWDSDQLEDRQKAMARTALSLALQEVWEAWWWEALMTCAKVQFAANTDLTEEVSPGFTFYNQGEDKYFTAVGSQSPPNDLGLSTLWTEFNGAAGELAQWDDAAAYVGYDQFTYGGTDYQCWANAPAGTLPTDSAYFLPLPRWVPTVPWLNNSGAAQGPFGTVRMVAKSDPRRYRNPSPFELVQTENGVEIPTLTVTHPFVWLRRVTPVLTGNDYSASTTYTATSASELVFDS
jgi:hypothetical protein